MSYYSALIPWSAGAAGTLTTNAGSTTVTVTSSANVLAGDLLVMVVYAEGDLMAARDAGEGWVLLDGGYNSTDNFAVGLYGCVAARAGSTRDGLTLPASMAWTAQNFYFRTLSGVKWDLGGAVGSGEWFNDATSATALTRPAFKGAGNAYLQAQGVNLAAGGYNNAATTTTIGNVTNYTEAFDTGQTAPPHGVGLNYMTTLTGAPHYNTLAATLAVAKTERGGLRAFVPVVGNIQDRSRTLSGRRMWG